MLLYYLMLFCNTLLSMKKIQQCPSFIYSLFTSETGYEWIVGDKIFKLKVSTFMLYLFFKGVFQR